MPRLPAIDPQQAQGKTRELLDGVQQKLGRTPNLLKTFANSPAVLQAYLGFSGALAEGALSPKLREQIGLTVSQANGCDYCLAAHTAIGKMVGLSAQDIKERGYVSDNDLTQLRTNGVTDGEIAEIIAAVALNTFTNYFNHVAEPELDFPKVDPHA